MRYSSRVLPLELVIGLCHDADLALLSIAKGIPTPFACFSTASIISRATIDLPAYVDVHTGQDKFFFHQLFFLQQQNPRQGVVLIVRRLCA